MFIRENGRIIGCYVGCQIRGCREETMNRHIYVRGFLVIGCIVYDDSVPVRMDCEKCRNKETCIYRAITFEEE